MAEAAPGWAMYRIGVKPSRSRARFFEWAGPATSLERAKELALADLPVAWRALAVGHCNPGAPLPTEGAPAQLKLISHIPDPQDFVLRYLPTWTIGQAMRKALGRGAELPQAPYRDRDADTAIAALGRHVAAGRGLRGSSGSLLMRIEVNDMETSPRKDVLGYNDSSFGDPPTSPDHPYLPTDPRITRAALAIAAIDLGRTSGKAKSKRAHDQAMASSHTLKAAAMARSHISRQGEILAWFAAIGLPEVAEQLRGMGA